MQSKEIPYRHAFKYNISASQMVLLKSRRENNMRLDPHTREEGKNNIRSLYFDDYNNRCFYENENGTSPREKFRIRIYNHSSEHITLECKRKDHGKTLKKSCPLTKEQADRLIRGELLEDLNSLPPLLRKLSFDMHFNGLRPVVIVEYERIPYIYKNGNVRVTFDINISSSSDVEDFFSDNLQKRPIMPIGQHLMEVKFDEFIPDYIYNSLNLGLLQQTTFSKYYLCRKFSIQK